jgi:membrane associated rhomboid family serine protease
MKRRKSIATDDRRQKDDSDKQDIAKEFDEYGLSRTVFAFAGMGALMGLLVGGTTMGFPTAVSSTIVGAVGGAILGRYMKTDH